MTDDITVIEEREELVVMVVNHRRFGYLLQPVWVKREAGESLLILGSISKSSSRWNTLPPLHQEIISLAGHYTDKALMKNYSKETVVSDFLKNVADKTIELYIRPTIEKYQKHIIQILEKSQLKIYIKNSVNEQVLFEFNRLFLSSGIYSAVFNFIKNETEGLHYFITIASNDEHISLKDQPFGIIYKDPACIFVGKKLLIFNDIDVNKLLPFFSKEYIVVPATSENMYIEKFMAECVRSNMEVNAVGIDIEEIHPLQCARLLLTNGIDGMPVLALDFMYDGVVYPFDEANKKTVYTQRKNGKTSLSWFYRDKEWETSLVNVLTDNGLERKWVNGFRIKSTDTDIHLNNLISWIQEHQDILKSVELDQDLSQQKYFLGEITVENDFEEKQDWFDLKSHVIFGSFRLPFAIFKNHILNGIREFILPDESIAILPSNWYSNYYELMFFGKEAGDKIRLNKRYLGSIDMPAIDRVIDYTPQEELYPLPKGLQATLRPYQYKGFCWLLSLSQKHLGACLADDMGLGKTLQTITLLQHFHLLRKKERANATLNKSTKLVGQLSLFHEDNQYQNSESAYPPSLVVVPTSLLHNWKNELLRFAPEQKVYLYSGNKRMKTKDLDSFLGIFDVVLTTYGTLRADINELQRCSFFYLILDESQYVKNPDSVTYQAVMRISSQHKLVLTGTPIENSLTDLWAQMNIINSGLLGGKKAFRQAYIEPAIQNKEKETSLFRIVKPFILRRTKNEVAPELPPLTEETIYTTMSEQQAEIYEIEKNKLRSSMIVGAPNLAFMTLRGLTRLRLLANHPRLLDVEYEGESGKFEQVIMCLETLCSENHKVLIFSSFVKHLRLLSDYCSQKNWKYCWLTGETSLSDREKEIDRYMKNADINCFFISIKAGGVGLNLTAADYVLILDPWWNPAVENQAISRSHRIGQDKHVMVYRFISLGTIEEKICRLQESKSKLAEILTDSPNPLQAMAKEDIIALLE